MYQHGDLLQILKHGISNTAKICFSNCSAGTSEDLDLYLSKLLERDVFLNIRQGGTSGTTTRIIKRTKGGKVIEKKKIVISKLCVPGYLSTNKTRNQGFMLYSKDGSAPRNVGAIKLKDDKEEPLEIPKL